MSSYYITICTLHTARASVAIVPEVSHCLAQARDRCNPMQTACILGELLEIKESQIPDPCLVRPSGPAWVRRQGLTPRCQRARKEREEALQTAHRDEVGWLSTTPKDHAVYATVPEWKL